MGKTHFYRKFILLFIIGILPLKAEEIVVETLSQGACWIEQGEFFRLASFNDKEMLISSKEILEQDIMSLVGSKLNQNPSIQKEELDVSLHCGAVGASLVFKIKSNDIPICAWAKINKGRIELRSIGGLADEKNELCDGHELGELIVGVKSLEALEDPEVLYYLKSKSIIAKNVFKIILKTEYIGKEVEVLKALNGLKKFRYVELSSIQHPVGEYIKLK
jgi:hypothetical protein